MRTEAYNYARILAESCEGKLENEVNEVIAAFAKVLRERGKLPLWRAIVQELGGVWKETYGASIVEVSSAYTLEEETVKKLEALAPGADYTYTVDEDLIGGMRLRIDDTLIEGTVRGQLTRLKNKLA